MYPALVPLPWTKGRRNPPFLRIYELCWRPIQGRPAQVLAAMALTESPEQGKLVPAKQVSVTPVPEGCPDRKMRGTVPSPSEVLRPTAAHLRRGEAPNHRRRKSSPQPALWVLREPRAPWVRVELPATPVLREPGHPQLALLPPAWPEPAPLPRGQPVPSPKRSQPMKQRLARALAPVPGLALVLGLLLDPGLPTAMRRQAKPEPPG